MTAPPGESGARTAVIRHEGRRHLWRTRLSHAGARGLRRLRDYLHSPAGRRATARAAGAVAVAAAAAGAVILVRGWLAGLGERVARAGAGLRAVTGTIAASSRAVRTALSLRWLGGLMRWLARTGSFRRYRSCPECHSRVRWDAAVCYGCGYRPGGGARLGDVARSRGAVAGSALWLGRAAILRLRRSCPDCRRGVHADARVCRHCGYRLAAPIKSP